MPRSSKRNAIIRDLGDGLVLRRAAPDDAGMLTQFIGRVFGKFEKALTRDLMSGTRPEFRPRDFTIVEDTRKRKIVSTLCLFSQRWSYGGVEFAVGRPELVATDADYRRRGLVRAQFDIIHEWSAKRGHMLQAITGIPNFYRQFGYEMALELGASRRGQGCNVPKLKEGEEEPCLVRPATEADLPFMARMYAQGRQRSLVSNVLSPKLWRYYLTGRTPGEHWEQFCIIETARGKHVGLLAHNGPRFWRATMTVVLFELKAGVSWLAVTPSVMRYLAAKGAEYASRDGKSFEAIAFELGTRHPAYEAMPDFLQPTGEPYAFYLRVPDLPGFLRLIAPVLEERLAKSIAPEWTGELKLSFYRDGLRLAFSKGKLTVSEPWSPAQGGESACFRSGTFVHMLFGLHSMEDLRRLNPDCYACSGDAKVLLRILFPKQPSNVWAVT